MKSMAAEGKKESENSDLHDSNNSAFPLRNLRHPILRAGSFSESLFLSHPSPLSLIEDFEAQFPRVSPLSDVLRSLSAEVAGFFQAIIREFPTPSMLLRNPHRT
jgi:hypothetical protein